MRRVRDFGAPETRAAHLKNVQRAANETTSDSLTSELPELPVRQRFAFAVIARRAVKLEGRKRVACGASSQCSGVGAVTHGFSDDATSFAVFRGAPSGAHVRDRGRNVPPLLPPPLRRRMPASDGCLPQGSAFYYRALCFFYSRSDRQSSNSGGLPPHDAEVVRR